MIVKYKIFENLKKAEKLINEYKPHTGQKYTLNRIKGKISTGYYGKFVEFLLVDKVDSEDLLWAAEQLNRFKLSKPIDEYDFESLNKELIKKLHESLHKHLKTRNIIELEK